MFVRESQKIPSGYADTNGSCARYSRMPCTFRNCNPGSTLFYTDFNVHTDKSYANTRSISNWVYSEINFLLKRIEESSRPAGPLMEGGWPGGGGRPSQWGRRQKLRPAPCLSFYADDGVIDLCFCVFSFGRFLVGYLSICSWNFVSHIFSYCLHIVTFRK